MIKDLKFIYIVLFFCFRLLLVNAESFPIEYGTKYGYLDENLQVMQKPIYDSATNFADGIAVVKLNSQFFIIDEEFHIKKEIIADICYEPSCNHILCCANHKWFFVDYNGNLVSDLFEQAYSFIDEYATVKKNGKYYFLTKDNLLLSAPPGYSYNSSPKEKFIIVNDNNNIQSMKTHYGMIDIYGKEIIPLKYSALSYSYEGICNAGMFDLKKQKKWGWINQNGEIITEPVFSAVQPFVHGVGCAKKENCWYIIDPKGKEIFEFDSSIDITSKFSENGICIYSKIVDSYLKYGYISNSGKIITEALFQNCYLFCGKYAQAVLNGKNVIIDESGKIYFVKDLFKIEEDDSAIAWG